jgi:hypothetical protein
MSDNQDTAVWLRELGAARPMAPAGREVLVLGQLSDGFYPIEWTRYRDTWTRDINGQRMVKDLIERWSVFGVPTSQPLTREDCERILKATEVSGG